MAQRVAGVALFMTALLGCSIFTGGISGSDAIRIAQQHAGPTAVLVSVEVGNSTIVLDFLMRDVITAEYT